MLKSLFILLVLIGCKGGSGDCVNPKEITIEVPPHALKIAYLPIKCLNGDIIYIVDTNLTEGNVTLLDKTTGKYSYLR